MAITVTATQGGSTANGIQIRVMVLTNVAATQNGASATQSASVGAHQASITTTQTGSRVYGAIVSGSGGTSLTAASGTTLIDDVPDATNGEHYGSCKTTAATGTPGATTVGASAPSNGGGCALYEVMPNGTITEDGSGPAVATVTNATTVTTASFTPPAGALLVALVASDGGTSVTTMTVSGGGLTWVAKAQANATSDDYAGVWIAAVPASGGAAFPFVIVQPRRARGMLPRRSKPITTVPPQSDPTPRPEVVQPRRIRGLLPRRAKPIVVVPARATPGPGITWTASGMTPMGVSAISVTIDITNAFVGDQVYCFIALGLNSGAVSSSGWTSLLDADEGTSAHYALLRRQKQLGDTTFTFSWTTSTKGTAAWVSYFGLAPIPDEGATLATNGVTSRTAVPTPTATPTSTNRWAVGFFGVRTTTPANKPITWTPDAAQVKRFDSDNSSVASGSPWLGIQIADTNAPVTQVSHSYTGTHNAAESHDGSAILFLIPAQTGAPLPNFRPRLVPPALSPVARRTRKAEVVPPQFNPPFPWAEVVQPRRQRGLLLRRGKQAVPTPPQESPVPENVQPRRQRGWLFRKGKQAQVVPPQFNPPFPFQEIVQPRRLRGLLPRRAKPIEVVPAQLTFTNPPFPWSVIAQVRKLRGYPVRRAKPIETVPPQFNPPFPFNEVTQPRRFRGLLPRRAKPIETVPAQVTFVPVAYVPQTLRARVKSYLIDRGRISQQPVPPQFNPPYPFSEVVQPRRQRGLLPRRGRVAQPVAPQDTPVPEVVQPRRQRGWLFRRGKQAAPVPPQVVLAPPAYPPQTVRSRLKQQRLAPRGKVWQPPWPQAINPIPFRDEVWNFGHVTLRWVLNVVLNSKWKAGQVEPLKWSIGDVDRSKWSTGLSALKWSIGGVVVPNPDIPLSSLSLEYVRVPVSATVNGTAINPTADTVKMAFLSGVSTQPQVGDWKSASWDSVSANGTYFAQCLVGPGGATTLPAGTYYVWIQITDNPEVPVRQVGVLQVV